VERLGDPDAVEQAPRLQPVLVSLRIGWPHDNATIAVVSPCGRTRKRQRVPKASRRAERFDAYRLPELFSGLPRDAGAFPCRTWGKCPQPGRGSVFRLVAILCGIHTTAHPDDVVNPTSRLAALADPANLRAGRGDGTPSRARPGPVVGIPPLQVVHGRLRAALVEAPLARS